MNSKSNFIDDLSRKKKPKIVIDFDGYANALFEAGEELWPVELIYGLKGKT